MRNYRNCAAVVYGMIRKVAALSPLAVRPFFCCFFPLSVKSKMGVHITFTFSV